MRRGRLNLLTKHDLHCDCSSNCPDHGVEAMKKAAKAWTPKGFEYRDASGKIVNPVKYALDLWRHNQILSLDLIGVFLANNIMNWYEESYGALALYEGESESFRSQYKSLAEINSEVFFTKGYLDGTAPVTLLDDELVEMLDELRFNRALIPGTFRVVVTPTKDGYVRVSALWLENTKEVL